MPTRDEIFTLGAKKLRQDFAELTTVPHAALKGDEAHRLVRDFLNAHLPKRFTAGSGFILDRKDRVSKQTDVLIYDALNCPVYRASEEAGIFPSDNVAAVIEVKSRLDKERLTEAWDNIVAAKSLAKTQQPEMPFLVQTQTLGCVFAFDSAIKMETIEAHYRDLLRRDGLGWHIDALLVLDQGLITLAAKPAGFHEWAPMILEGVGGPHAEGSHIATAIQQLAETSLDGFFRMLLAHLTFFRGIVDHPGFRIEGKMIRLNYLTSITLEQDSQKRAQKLAEYAAAVLKEFAEDKTAGPSPMV